MVATHRIRRRRADPVLLVALALLCAAVLVIYFQRRALSTLDRQTSVILQTISEQTAEDVTEEIRAAIEGPAYDTLRANTLPDLYAGRLDLLLKSFGESLDRYPHVERLFVWNKDTEARVPGEVLFFSSNEKHNQDPWQALQRDPQLGPLIFKGARELARQKLNYAAIEHRVGADTYDILLRHLWLDAERQDYFMVTGFVVNVEQTATRLLPTLYQSRLAQRLHQTNGTPRLELQVRDSRERLIYSSGDVMAGIGASQVLALELYPRRIRPQLAGGFAASTWTVHVGPSATAGSTLVQAQNYWLPGLSILLMLVAFMVAVRGQKRARELAQMQSEFVSHVSHQLRTPLSLLTTITESMALDRVRTPEKLAQYIAIMRAETARLSVLVERVLEFSRGEGRGRSYQPERVELTALVKETVETVARKPAATGFDITVSSGSEQLMLSADPVALEQMLVNLLDNAVKYSGGSRTIDVGVKQVGTRAEVTVADHGPGIPPAEQARIFDRFYRGPAASGLPGFGLGLAIVKDIVAAHRGRLDVESAPGQGTLFRIRFPLSTKAL